MSGTSAPEVQSVPAGTLAWLERELDAWQAEGRVDAATAAGIRARYTAGRRLPLSRLMLALGASSAGVGLLWLVAANLDELAPEVRFTGVVLVWLAAAVGAAVLAARRTGRGTVGAVRLLAALAFGGVVFQAAQSLQVPAYEPRLLGAWAAGALLHAYAVGAVAPLLVGIGAGVGWYGWAVVVARDLLGRLEVAAATAALLLGWLLVLWQPPGAAPAGGPTGAPSGEALLRVAVVVAVYLLAALWTAALGVLRDEPRTTGLATAALVLFTVVQSFAVFAPVLSGATLFLALGAVLAVSGWLADRGRRGLVTTVREVAA